MKEFYRFFEKNRLDDIYKNIKNEILNSLESNIPIEIILVDPYFEINKIIELKDNESSPKDIFSKIFKVLILEGVKEIKIITVSKVEENSMLKFLYNISSIVNSTLNVQIVEKDENEKPYDSQEATINFIYNDNIHDRVLIVKFNNDDLKGFHIGSSLQNISLKKDITITKINFPKEIYDRYSNIK